VPAGVERLDCPSSDLGGRSLPIRGRVSAQAGERGRQCSGIAAEVVQDAQSRAEAIKHHMVLGLDLLQEGSDLPSRKDFIIEGGVELVEQNHGGVLLKPSVLRKAIGIRIWRQESGRLSDRRIVLGGKELYLIDAAYLRITRKLLL
jgi:hypothetical protein